MNLISLLMSHQSIDLTVLAIPSLNFLTIIRFQTSAIPLTQLAKNIYKLINHHIAPIRVMHTHWMIYLNAILLRQRENIILHMISFYNMLNKLMHEHNKFIIMQYLQSY
jgi:hypothetical protein